MAQKFGSVLLDVGNGNFILKDRILGIIAYDSDPTRRHCQELEKLHRTIDATRGKKVKSVVFLESSHVVLSSVARETLCERLENASFNSSPSQSIASPDLR